MNFSVKKHSDHCGIVAVEGRIDAQNAEVFKTSLADTVKEGLSHLVIDMQGVSFIDSSGLSVLVSGFRAVRDKDGTLALANVGPQVTMALEMTRLNELFSIFDSVETALEEC